MTRGKKRRNFVPDSLRLTAVEKDMLERAIQIRLCELDSYFDLSESEWRFCERRLWRRGIEVLRQRKLKEGMIDAGFIR